MVGVIEANFGELVASQRRRADRPVQRLAALSAVRWRQLYRQTDLVPSTAPETWKDMVAGQGPANTAGS